MRFTRNDPVATTEPTTLGGVQILSEDEWYAFFDAAVRAQMQMSGEEFIRRWNDGEYVDIADKAGHRHIMGLAMLIPGDRRKL
jgi:hypothetical protein